jgi:hypothetical protein
LEFADDVDKALFIVSQPKPSKNDQAYRAWLAGVGFSEQEIRTKGSEIRAAIKELTRQTRGGTVRNPVALGIPRTVTAPTAPVAAPETPAPTAPVVAPETPAPKVGKRKGAAPTAPVAAPETPAPKVGKRKGAAPTAPVAAPETPAPKVGKRKGAAPKVGKRKGATPTAPVAAPETPAPKVGKRKGAELASESTGSLAGLYERYLNTLQDEVQLAWLKVVKEISNLRRQYGDVAGSDSLLSRLIAAEPSIERVLRQYTKDGTIPTNVDMAEDARLSDELFAFNRLRLHFTAGTLGSATSAWAQEFRGSAARGGTTESALEALASDDQSVPEYLRVAASLLLDLYRRLGIPFPRASVRINEPGGSYSLAHVVTLGSIANASTLIHENLHALTVRGLVSLTEKNPKREADIKELADDLFRQASKALGTETYVLSSRGTAKKHRELELIAELLNPELLVAASKIPLDVSALSAGGKRALRFFRVRTYSNLSVLDAIIDVIGKMFSLISPTSALANKQSIADVINLMTVNAAAETSVAFGRGKRKTKQRGVLKSSAAPVREGISTVQKAAQKYAAKIGVTLTPVKSNVVSVDTERARRIAKAFDEMKHEPNNPEVQEAYENLARQVKEQYDALVAEGVEFYFIDPSTAEGIAYLASPQNAMRELRDHNRIGILPSVDAFGQGEVIQSPMLGDTGLKWQVAGANKEQTVTYNDMFRAVHDVFGHGLEGASFRALGEEQAWQAHQQLFTGSARRALTVETRGQNSWVNFGPRAEENRNATPGETVYAEQKVGLLPLWVSEDGALRADGESQFAETEKAYGGKPAYDKAKAAGETKLTYGQWVQVRTPNFKKWFGDWESDAANASKVVDPQTGEPMVVYHGTTHGKGSKTGLKDAIAVFSVAGIGKTKDAGAFSTSDPLVAESYSGRNAGSAIYAAFLNIKEPVTVDAQGGLWGNLSEAPVIIDGKQSAWTLEKLFGSPLAAHTDGLGRAVRKSNFDGAIILDVMDRGPKLVKGEIKPSTVFIAKRSNQIKSAIGNDGGFSESDDRIFKSSVEGEEVEGSKASSPRTKPSENIERLVKGKAAPSATPGRGFKEALRSGDMGGVKRALLAALEKLNVGLHDSVVPAKRWLQGLSLNSTKEGELLVDKAIDSLYAAQGIKQHRLSEAMKHGGDRVQELLQKITVKYDISAETAKYWVGSWITASYAEERNLYLINKDAAAVDRLVAELAKKPGDKALGEALDEANKNLRKRIEAVLNPDPYVDNHVRGVAGYNNAGAAAIMGGVESRISRAELEAVAESVYDMNAWSLIADIESGKTTPEIANGFLDVLPEDESSARLELLKELYRQAESPTSMLPEEAKRLEETRKAALQAVRSHYIPLTGDPEQSLEGDMFTPAGQRPNTAKDYHIEGRTSSVPDDAITATWAKMIRTANYAGWAPFQDAIAGIASVMTPAERDEAGLSVHVHGKDDFTSGQNAIVRRRGNSVVSYGFRDRGILDAIRGANTIEAHYGTGLLGTLTKYYGYAATQMNLMFAPVNTLRDVWERTELLRSRHIVDEAGDKIEVGEAARAALNYVLNPAYASSLFSATWRHAAGREAARTREAIALEELISLGGISTISGLFAANPADFVAGVDSARSLVTKGKKALETYNRTFDLVSSLGVYLALRDAGVGKKSAAAHTLDLMNFRKVGKYSGIFRSLYAFAQPAFTGGANMIGALYNPHSKAEKVGSSFVIKKGLVRLLGTTTTLMVLNSIFRAIADDDEGGDKLAQVNDLTQVGNLLVPFGKEGFVKVPLAYGMPRIANYMARALIGVSQGELSKTEALGKLMSNVVTPGISPLEGTDIDWSKRPAQAMALTFAPSIFKPVASIGVNRTASDTPVVFDSFSKRDVYRSEQFGKNVPQLYRDVAKWTREMFGLDYAPEEYRVMLEGYPMGSLSVVRSLLVDNPYRKERGLAVSNPVLSRFYSHYSEGGKMAQFYAAIEATDELNRRINAGERRSSLSRDELNALAWRESWNSIDSALRSQSRGVSKLLSDSARKKTQAEQRAARLREQIKAVGKWRKVIGLD